MREQKTNASPLNRILSHAVAHADFVDDMFNAFVKALTRQDPTRFPPAKNSSQNHGQTEKNSEHIPELDNACSADGVDYVDHSASGKCDLG